MSDELKETHRRHAAERGYSFSDYEWQAEVDPEFEAMRLAYVDMTYLRKDCALETKYRELISALLLSMRDHPTAELHVRRAIRAGLSVREVLEAFQQASVPGGQATMLHGVTILRKLVQEEGFEMD